MYPETKPRVRKKAIPFEEDDGELFPAWLLIPSCCKLIL
jgi:hypothetical protein